MTAYIPVIAMLLVPHHVSGLGAVGRGLTYLTLGGLLLNAAALVAPWLKAPLVNDDRMIAGLKLCEARPDSGAVSLVAEGAAHEER